MESTSSGAASQQAALGTSRQHMPDRQTSLSMPTTKRRRPMCDSCEKSVPNQIVFNKIEAIVRRMQDDEQGLPVKTANRFMSKIPSVFTGADLVTWMQRNLRLEDQQEAVHLANLIASHGYIFPIEDHALSIKNDATFYRFQTPCLWPSHIKEAENTDYAVYLCKRTMQGKTRLDLADYEAENLARLQKMFSRKWDFIFMEAESQAKVDKKRDKLERKVFDSQERAFWDVHRPVPGCVNTTELDIKKACRASKSSRRCEDCHKISDSKSEASPDCLEKPPAHVEEVPSGQPNTDEDQIIADLTLETKNTCQIIEEEEHNQSVEPSDQPEERAKKDLIPEPNEAPTVVPESTGEAKIEEPPPSVRDKDTPAHVSENKQLTKRKACHHHHQHHHHPHGHHNHQRHRKCPHGKQIPSDKSASTRISSKSHRDTREVKGENVVPENPVSSEQSSSTVDETKNSLLVQKPSGRRMSECNHIFSKKIEVSSLSSNLLNSDAARQAKHTRKGSLNMLRPSESVDGRALSPGLQVGTAVAIPAHHHHPPLKVTQSVCVEGSPGIAELHISNLERELDALRIQFDQRAGSFKMSKVTQSYLGYFTQWADYDPFVAQPVPSNPWVSDSSELWDSERQTKDVHFRRVRRWAFCLRELLSDPAGHDQFHRFLEKEFSAENLKFWDAVQELKRVASRDVARRVEVIWSEFLAPDANCPINIDSKSYETSKLNMAKNRNNRYIFDEAAGHVYQLMKNDSYPRYLRSDMYKDYKEASERKRTNQVAFDVFKPQITTLKQKFNF